jgi:hypothetical protein
MTGPRGFDYFTVLFFLLLLVAVSERVETRNDR